MLKYTLSLEDRLGLFESLANGARAMWKLPFRLAASGKYEKVGSV